MRVVQLRHPTRGRAVAEVEGERLRVLGRFNSTVALANAAIGAGVRLTRFVAQHLSGESLGYDPIYRGKSEWQLLPPVDHPDEPARCMVSGTGLTHIASARNRDAMHNHVGAASATQAAVPGAVPGAGAGAVTDSMKMFQWGVEGGKPPAGAIGVSPEWFYKGTGTILLAHNEPLDVPAFADDGGEEPEVVGCYLVDPKGTVRRLGFAIGNEFSDHQLERKNYLYLAPSKLRCCALGPELAIDAELRDVRGTVRIERAGQDVWSRAVATGEDNMCHSVANLEHHHFKYPQHRRPGDVHLHFLGADAFSFGAGVALQDADVMVVEWQGLGRPLRNPIRIDRSQPATARVEPV